MERFLTEKILNWCDKASPVSAKQRAIVGYGIELLLETVIKIVIIVLLGFLLHQGPETLLVLAVFCVLRSFAGGSHMKTNAGCAAAMVFMWGISLAAGKWLVIADTGLWLGFAASVASLLMFAPAETRQNRVMAKAQKRRNKIASVAFTFLFYLGAMFFLDGSSRMLVIMPVWTEILSILFCGILPDRNSQGG